MSFRQTIIEKDLSSFVIGNANEVGGFVIKAKKGPTYPILIRNTDDFLTWFGYPNQDFWGGFEVLNYINTAPAWVTRVVGSGYKHAGVDVTLTSVLAFGEDTGRTIDGYDVSSVNTQYIAKVKTSGTGTYDTWKQVIASGSSTIYAGNIFSTLNGATFEPNTANHLKIKVYSNNGLLVRELSGLTIAAGPNNTRTISDGSVILDGTQSSINVSTGAISLDFNGTVGTPFVYRSGKTYAAITTEISIPANKQWGIYLNIDGIVIDNGNLEITIPEAGLTVEDVVDQLNARIDASELQRDDLVSYDTASDRIVISGTKADSNNGFFRMKGASDTDVYSDPITYIFELQNTYTTQLNTYDGLKETDFASNPTGYVLRSGDYVEVSYIVNKDMSSQITHSFFASSPYEDKDFDYKVAVQYTPDSSIVGGNRIYTLNLYQTLTDGKSDILAQYIYSLDKIKDRNGASLYITDIFRNNPYLLPVVNTDLTEISRVNENVSALSILNAVRLTGGKRGNNPTDSDMLRGWNYYKKAKRYPVKLFMNVYADTTSFNAIKDLLSNYQKYSFGISIVPYNLTPQDAIDYRQALNIDSDKMAIYHNWQQIVDPFNGNTRIWVSGIGKIGKAYAQMENIFDAESPAGVNENGIGGQIDSTGAFPAIDVQYDYDDYYLKALDDSQINPLMLDPIYGLIIKGDRTLRVTRGDTAYVGARRLYNYILSNIIDQVLTLQEFRLNDSFHRGRMTEFCTQIIQPILNAGYLREAQIICDDSNNTNEVLNRREFVIDVYVKVTPNSQFIKLNFIRLSQTQSIGSIG